MRTVTQGIVGTSMPSFALLPAAELNAVVDYVILLAQRGETELLLIAYAEAEEEMIENTGIMPLLFFGFQNIVSSKVKGWEENVMDVHPSRFITVER